MLLTKNKLVPRFFYTLSPKSYCGFNNSIFSRKHQQKISKPVFKENHQFYVNYARVALGIILRSLSKTPINVGVQALTCHTVFQAIKNSGHSIVFLDIDNNLKLSISSLCQRIEEIDVLIMTHTFGFPDKIDEIKKIAKNKIIIEDCAHSFLAEYNGQKTGSYGDAAVFSTGLGKFPPIGTNGFFVINDFTKFPSLLKEWESIKKPNRSYEIRTKIKLILLSLFMKPPLYGLITYPLGKRLDKKFDFANKFDVLERRGFSWVKKMIEEKTYLYDRIKTHQTNNAKLLSSLIQTKSFYVDSNKKISPNNYVFPLLVNNREELFNKLLFNNIEAGKHFSNALKWGSSYGYKKGECQHAESVVDKIITIPIHYGVSKRTLYKAAKIINEHINETKQVFIST